MKMNSNIEKTLTFIDNNPGLSSSQIFELVGLDVGLVTIKRYLAGLVLQELLTKKGKGRATKYFVTPLYKLSYPIDVELYFTKEIDERDINQKFNQALIDDSLANTTIFSKQELERLGIDLSWKSSQIEGNTYSLLETELLLKEKIQAKGKKQQEAIMLLNHKDALDYVVDDPTYFKKIEEVHSLLTKGLDIDKNIRKRVVGITGTNYTPLDNEFHIREAIEKSCDLVNLKENIFEKSLLILVLLSYIQAFADGNKRTARIISNSILIANNCCPISFRSADSLEYKKTMLIFYEQNNLHAFKQLYIEQCEFAVNNYFR